ncbi:TPA: hypothetical protein ACOEQU_000176 [Stenotrophomonas maltophilia]
MSDNRSDTSAEADLAREIFARSISVRLGAGESQLNAQGVATRAFESARTFFEVQSARTAPVKLSGDRVKEKRKE